MPRTGAHQVWMARGAAAGGTAMCTMLPPNAAQRPEAGRTEPTPDEPDTRMGAGTESTAPQPLSRVTSAGRKVHPGAAEPFDPGYGGGNAGLQRGGGLARIKPQSFLITRGARGPLTALSSLGIGGRSVATFNPNSTQCECSDDAAHSVGRRCVSGGRFRFLDAENTLGLGGVGSM